MNTPKIATSATGTEYTWPDPYPQCEGSGASPCSPTIYEVLRNNIKAIDPETETGAWGIEVLEGILAICPEENV